MLKQASKFLKSTGGAHLIEFAFTAPIFFLLVIGSIDVSIMLIVQNALDAGARAASRFGITGQTGSGDRTAAIVTEINKTVGTYSGGIIDPKKLTINVIAYPDLTNFHSGTNSTANSYGAGGQVVKYTISYKWNSFLALFGVPSPVTLTGIAAVQNENF